MNGFGGAGTLSDGKYNLTTEFGGDLHRYVGQEKAMELMNYVDGVLCEYDHHQSKLFSTANSDLKTTALRNDLHLLSAQVRHFGTERIKVSTFSSLVIFRKTALMVSLFLFKKNLFIFSSNPA